MQVILVAHKNATWVGFTSTERLINQLGQGVNKTEITHGREQFPSMQALGTQSFFILSCIREIALVSAIKLVQLL